MRVRLPASFPALLLLFVLAACGGGGGGGGSTTTNGSGNTGGGAGSGGSGGGGGGPSIPMDPPAAPTVTYNGNRNSATLTDDAVSTIADDLYAAIMVSLKLSDESTNINLPATNLIDANFNGPEGGTVHATGRVDDEGVGWIQYDAVGFGEDGYVWTGTQVFEGLQINNGKQDSLTDVHFYDLRVLSPFGDVTLRGTVRHRGTIIRASSVGSIST